MCLDRGLQHCANLGCREGNDDTTVCLGSLDIPYDVHGHNALQLGSLPQGRQGAVIVPDGLALHLRMRGQELANVRYRDGLELDSAAHEQDKFVECVIVPESVRRKMESR